MTYKSILQNKNSKPIIRTKIESIELERKNVQSAKKGDDIGINFGKKVNTGTEVYLIKKNI